MRASDASPARGARGLAQGDGGNAAPADTHYVDGKRYRWLASVLEPPLLVAVSVGLDFLTGWGLFMWLPLFVGYVVFPLLDYFEGEDPNNPPEVVVGALEADKYYRYLTYSIIPLQFLTFLGAAWLVGTGNLSVVEFLGLTLSVGFLGGIAINTGHELGHKKAPLERNLAKLSLAMIGYGHFSIEHNKGHHRDVATPEDTASSRFGESLYKFMRREVAGAWRRAWEIERTRLQRQGKSEWSLDNEIVQTSLMTATLYIGLLAAFGPLMLPFLALYTAYGYFQLTLANYVEHYGLCRQKLSSGRYERVRPEHSWNSNHIVTNLVSFHLQRHSDHHANPTRRYQALRHFDDSPQLPSGYGGMFLVAMFPPLWRRIMDPRVVRHYGGDMSRANIDPDVREKVLRTYHNPRHAHAAA